MHIAYIPVLFIFFSVIKKYLKDRIIFCIFFINIRIYEYKFIYFGKVIDWNAHTIIHFENKCTFCEVLMYCAKVKYNFCQNILKSRFRNLKNMFQLFFFSILFQEVVGQVHEVFVTFMKKPSYQVFIKMIF